MAESPQPTHGIVLTHFIVAADVERSRRFYTDVLGGETVREGEPAVVALANGWIIINVGGGPTDDKPTVTLETPRDPDRTSSFLNIRVADIASVYEEWRARGAEFLTPPKQHKTEIRCYIRDPDGHLIEVGQTTPSSPRRREVESSMSQPFDYDVIVFGGGAPGEHCAGALAEGGLRVAVVERELVGGECSYWACIPSKTLLRPGESVQAARDATAHADVDVEAALAWRDFMVSNYTDDGQQRWLADRNIDLLRGNGKLAGPGAVEVDGVRHTAEHIVVATGADPFVPPVPGLREIEGVWGTRDATSLKAVPRRLVVLGGGAAGVELAQALHRLGGEAVIVEAADHVLPREPRPLGEALGDALIRDGVEVLVDARAAEARRDGEEYVLELEDGHEVRGDRLLVATGRRPHVSGIGLESVGVEADPHGIPVDAHHQAGERLWAIGDVTGIWPLTHMGEYQGDVVAANILGEPRVANYEAVPRVTYTDPQAAAVGATDDRFNATALVSEVSKTATYTRAYAESNGFLTLLSDGERLTGAYALGPEAGEWLQQATLAIRGHVPLEVLRDTIQPFPSFSEIYNAALKALRHEIAPVRPATESLMGLDSSAGGDGNATS